MPVYLSLAGILSNHPVQDSNPEYASLHPIRAALYEKAFNGPAFIISILSVWLLIEAITWWKYRRGNPKQKELIKFILNQYREKAFNIHPGDPEDHHRVTLFKYKKRHMQLRSSQWIENPKIMALFLRAWPKSCLVYFLRSGKLSQNTRAVFPVYDESDKNNGWAAHVWSTGCAAVVDQLPDILADKNKDKAKEKEYARKTKSTEAVVSRYWDASRPMPRSIAAIPIEVHGSLWGVLVLDSRRPDGVSQESIDNFRITVAAIQKILEVKL